MAQKDYVRRGRSITPHKNKHSGKKKLNQGLLKTTFAVAIVIVVIFISVLYYVTQNKPVLVLNKTTFLNNSQPVSSLPPKPEERWRYIKELEKRGIGTDLLNFNNSTKSNINNTTDLTNEQRYFLEQIDADRSNPATNLSEVPNNDNVSRSRVIINGPSIESPLWLKPVPQSQQATNIQQKIVVHCSSFKNMEQAESLKANLAFSGLESRISSIKGWHQLILGPYNQETAKKIRDLAKSVGLSGCILHTTKG
ncbi:MAG: SPOR domain-containing protein [Arsenophonus sp. NEOnobi-MAG3]